MAKRLGDDGHQVRVLVGGTPDMEVPRRFADKGLDFRCIRSMGREIHPWKDLRALLAIRREIRRFKPDLLSTHASKAGALGRFACLGKGVPALYTPHCWSFVDGFPKARFYRRLEGFLARMTSKIVAVCDDEREFGLRRGVGRGEQTVTVHNGVNDLPGATTRDPDGGGGEVRLVMVGRFERQKDQPLLLRALAGVADLPWAMTFVGDGPDRAGCVALAEELGIDGRVTFAGYCDRVESHVAGCDVFALVSNWEGFPRSILEAMRSGVPVIASDVGGCRESVLDGQTGRVVPKGAQGELEGALRELLSDRAKRERMGRRGRERYLERFTFDAMYRKYCELYASLVSGAGDRVGAAAPADLRAPMPAPERTPRLS